MFARVGLQGLHETARGGIEALAHQGQDFIRARQGAGGGAHPRLAFVHAAAQATLHAGIETGDFRQEIGAHGHGLFSGSRRRGRAQVGGMIDQRRVRLVAHGGDHGNAAGRHGTHHDFLVEAPQVLERAAAAGDDDDVGLASHVIEAGNGRGHLRGTGLALHAHRPHNDVTREAFVEPVQDVADDGPRGRGDNPDELRKIGDRPLARGIEQPLGGELLPALLEQRHEGADTGGLDVLDDDLVGGLQRI